MKYLLDTQVLYWLDQEPDRLSDRARGIIADPANRLYFSVGSLWEMVIKIDLGELHLDKPVLEFVEAHQRVNGLELLDISLDDVRNLVGLPLIHRDPFDRILIAQSMAKQLTIVSADAVIKQYPILCEW